MMEPRRLESLTFRKCPCCDGQIIGVGVLRQLGLKPLAMELWQKVLQATAEQRTSKKCGSCENGLLALTPEADATGEVLGGCKTCQLIWLGRALPGLDKARRVDYQLTSEAAGRLEQESFEHVPQHAAESESVIDHVLDYSTKVLLLRLMGAI